MKIFSSLLVAVLFLTTQFSLADTTCVHYPGASEFKYGILIKVSSYF